MAKSKKKSTKAVAKQASTQASVAFPYRGRYTLLSPLLVICAQVIAMSNLTLGVYANALVFLVLCGFAIKEKAAERLCEILAVIPLANIAAIAFRSSNKYVFWLVLYAVIGVMGIIYQRTYRLYPKVKNIKVALGRKQLNDVIAQQLPLLILVGQYFGLMAYALFGKTSLFELNTTLLIGLAFVATFIEEIFFRGLLQNVIQKTTGANGSIVLSALLYPAVLAPFVSTKFTIYILLNGLVMAVIYNSRQKVSSSFYANLACKLTFIALVLFKGL